MAALVQEPVAGQEIGGPADGGHGHLSCDQAFDGAGQALVPALDVVVPAWDDQGGEGPLVRQRYQLIKISCGGQGEATE